MKSSAKVSGQQTLQTVDRALSFMEFVASADQAPTIQTVANELDLNITTSYHLLRTLVARGYIERQPDLTLTLGSRVGDLFRAYQQRFNAREGLMTLASTLAEQTSETAWLSLRKGNRVILEALIESSQRLRVSGLFVGLSGNEHLRSSGKAVLAHLDPSERTEMLAPIFASMTEADASHTATELEQELEKIRVSGWSLDDQGLGVETSSVGAPIFSADGRVYGAIGISTPTTRMRRNKKGYIDAVRRTANDATALLGGIPSP
ncbi:IclR family transcriptional regulator [Arthrobacter sp. MI7-26]|uniref:IclR family transcriptional regulator n=1 Tax=Arthrobacter sp. MI7-26 TaxID=2993653 RepID=UPI002248DC5B|nr:IclR family transcriptional regulator [Arthrobacter sp. MI7-26]MCX2748069.1 IclR family transcriptional regulator [Arthrobacter sp. MI7-26]